MSIPLNRRKVLGLMAVAATGVAVGACQSAAPAAAAPAGSGKLFLAVDLVEGSTNIPKEQAATRSCVLSSRFPRNSQLVWRARVFDPKTGDTMDDKALSSMKVTLSDGQAMDMHYGAHPKDTGDSFWTVSWVVPKDQATGTFKYSVKATSADGRTGTFEPLSAAANNPALPAIIDEVLPDAPSKG